MQNANIFCCVLWHRIFVVVVLLFVYVRLFLLIALLLGCFCLVWCFKISKLDLYAILMDLVLFLVSFMTFFFKCRISCYSVNGLFSSLSDVLFQSVCESLHFSSAAVCVKCKTCLVPLYCAALLLTLMKFLTTLWPYLISILGSSTLSKTIFSLCLFIMPEHSTR